MSLTELASSAVLRIRVISSLKAEVEPILGEVLEEDDDFGMVLVPIHQRVFDPWVLQGRGKV